MNSSHKLSLLAVFTVVCWLPGLPLQGQPANPKPGSKWTSPDGLEMVWIPPGEFQMGSPASEKDRNPPHNDENETWEETQHKVRLAKGFWMDSTEVTNAAFSRFLKAKPEWQKERVNHSLVDSLYLEKWTGATFPAGQENYPVVTVSWYAARAYCAWAGGRLPTEAEWEYAARAGTTTAYWWGDQFDATRLNMNQKNTEPVGDSHRTNAWGLADMLGNVQEWTSSLSLPYPYRADDGRENLDPTGLRIERGGGFRQSAAWSRSAVRTGFEPTFTTRRLGMRCVR